MSKKRMKRLADLDEHDLERIKNWITYCEKMYEKTSDEKYKKGN